MNTMAKQKKMDDRVLLTRAEYRALLKRIEDLEDVMLAIQDKREESRRDYLPAALVNRLAEGEHPLKIWRKHRKLTLAALSGASGLPASYVSEIETRKKPGSIDAMKKLAAALQLDIDDLVR